MKHEWWKDREAEYKTMMLLAQFTVAAVPYSKSELKTIFGIDHSTESDSMLLTSCYQVFATDVYRYASPLEKVRLIVSIENFLSSEVE